VVGEVRGAEALDMLQAMNTGHDGSCRRCAQLPAMACPHRDHGAVAGVDLPVRAIREQARRPSISSCTSAACPTVTAHHQGVRHRGMEGDVITLADIFVYERADESGSPRCSARRAAPPHRRQVRDLGIEIRPKSSTRPRCTGRLSS
jgi:pilus assembly protein CpaF